MSTSEVQALPLAIARVARDELRWWQSIYQALNSPYSGPEEKPTETLALREREFPENAHTDLTDPRERRISATNPRVNAKDRLASNRILGPMVELPINDRNVRNGYWPFINDPKDSALISWSAAFISACVLQGWINYRRSQELPPSFRGPLGERGHGNHAVYAKRAYDEGSGSNRYKAFDIWTTRIQVGDIIVRNRSEATLTYESLRQPLPTEAKKKEGHGDIVIAVEPHWAWVVGGNVRVKARYTMIRGQLVRDDDECEESVCLRCYALDHSGIVIASPAIPEEMQHTEVNQNQGPNAPERFITRFANTPAEHEKCFVVLSLRQDPPVTPVNAAPGAGGGSNEPVSTIRQPPPGVWRAIGTRSV